MIHANGGLAIDYTDFEFVQTLGRGTHGTVILVERKSDKQKVCV